MNWVHLHLALNHIPVLGTLFVGILLVTALVKRSDELKRLSLVWFVALMAISIPIKFTGDFAFESAANSPWLPVAGVAAHERAADQATTGMFLLGLLAAFGLFRGRGQRSLPRWVVTATLILALATFAMMARTANLGGQLRHEEIRPETPKQAGFHNSKLRFSTVPIPAPAPALAPAPGLHYRQRWLPGLKRGHGSLRMAGQQSTSGSRSENSAVPMYN
jgi:uncharacterized membrane protein